MDKIEFKYGQWVVELQRKASGISWVTGEVKSDYVTIDVTGKWVATDGILYNNTRPCCVYDRPEILPKGLKDRIYKKAMKLLEE